MYVTLHLSLFEMIFQISRHTSISDTIARKIQAKNGIPPPIFAIIYLALASYFAVLCININFCMYNTNRFLNMVSWRSVNAEHVSHWMLLQ